MHYVEQIGHRWATQAVPYKTRDAAVAAARRDAKDAMKTTVYDCTTSPGGAAIVVIGTGGGEEWLVNA
jgi:hypothetical protein